MHCNGSILNRVFPENGFWTLLTLVLLVLGGRAAGQSTGPAAGGEVIEILKAGQLKGLKTGLSESRELLGSVAIRHKGALMYCDRAIQNLTNNSIEAFGNVRIVQGDTVTVKGDTLFYFGATRQANVRGRVTLRDRKMTLTTRRLDYDMLSGLAYYPVPGRIVDRENVLNSREGYYDTRTKLFTFRQNVRLVNPKYTLTADSLLYNSFSKIATFQGPTRIVSKDGTLVAKEGEYNTVTRVSNFQRRATIETDKYRLTGDSLGGNSSSEFYVARGNVVLFAKSDKTKKRGTGKMADSAKALKQIEKTPVHEGWTYKDDPTKEQRIGPMAQDVQRISGEHAAPGGKVIDMVSQQGRMMAAVQELARKVKKLEAA